MSTLLQLPKYISKLFEKTLASPEITPSEAQKLFELTSNRAYTSFKMTREGQVLIYLAPKGIPANLAMNLDNSLHYFAIGSNQTTKINTPETASKLAQALANKRETKKDFSLYEIYLLFKHDKSKEYTQHELQSAILDDSDFINYLKSFGQTKLYIKTQIDLNIAFNAQIIQIDPVINYDAHSQKARVKFNISRNNDHLANEYSLDISNKVKSDAKNKNTYLGLEFLI